MYFFEVNYDVEETDHSGYCSDHDDDTFCKIDKPKRSCVEIVKINIQNPVLTDFNYFDEGFHCCCDCGECYIPISFTQTDDTKFSIDLTPKTPEIRETLKMSVNNISIGNSTTTVNEYFDLSKREISLL